LISATGKYSWGSIPTPNLLISAFNNELSLFKVLPFNPLPMVLVFVLVVIFFLKLIRKSSSPSKKWLNISIALCCLVLPSTYWFNAHLNSTKSHWFARNIVREDPFLGFILGDNPAISPDKKQVVDNSIELELIEDPPNIILIVCDALRADHMSLYNYAQITSPRLDSIQTRHTNFNKAELATSSCTSSLCGILSILFGHNFGDLPFNKKGVHDYLKEAGYHTSFILSGMHKDFYNLQDQYGPNIDLYYESDAYLNDSIDLPFYDDNALINCLKNKKEQLAKADRHFFYFHVMAPHILCMKNEENKTFNPSEFLLKKHLSKEMAAKVYKNNYKNGIVQADYIIDKLLRELASQDILDNSMVIITADHGEALGEHKVFKYLGHSMWPTYEMLHIPMIIIDSDSRPNYRMEYATHIDLLPTIIDRVSKSHHFASTYDIPGISLLDPEPVRRFTYHVQKMKTYPKPAMAILKQEPGKPLYKYLYDYNTEKEFVFNLTKDPNERRSLKNKQLLKTFRNERQQYMEDAALSMRSDD
jgi:glucan phosphoethanolaminetransferase (alkaline phosphatase superfamily)